MELEVCRNARVAEASAGWKKYNQKVATDDVTEKKIVHSNKLPLKTSYGKLAFKYQRTGYNCDIDIGYLSQQYTYHTCIWYMHVVPVRKE